MYVAEIDSGERTLDRHSFNPWSGNMRLCECEGVHHCALEKEDECVISEVAKARQVVDSEHFVHAINERTSEKNTALLLLLV